MIPLQCWNMSWRLQTSIYMHINNFWTHILELYALLYSSTIDWAPIDLCLMVLVVVRCLVLVDSDMHSAQPHRSIIITFASSLILQRAVEIEWCVQLVIKTWQNSLLKLLMTIRVTHFIHSKFKTWYSKLKQARLTQYIKLHIIMDHVLQLLSKQ